MQPFKFYDKPRYNKEDISLSLAGVDDELKKLKEELRQFLIANHKYFTLEEQAQLLGTTTKVVLELLPKNYLKTVNSHRAQTVVIWRAPEVAEEDNKKFLNGDL